jgi:uncharacterized membrane protein YvlD (DUF360 family)
VWSIDVCTLGVVAALLPGLELDGWRALVLAVGAIGLLNALVRPVLLLLTLPLTLPTFGLWSLVLSAVSVGAAGWLVPGFAVSWPAALVVSVVLALVNAWATAALTLDERESLFGHLATRAARRRPLGGVPAGAARPAAAPRLIIAEIDGLSRRTLERTLARGEMPTLAGWLARGSHRLTSYDCGLPSQTSSSQAGILWGVSDDVPAFRWYEKERGRLVVSSRASDVALIEARLRHGTPLLVGGSSHCNMFTGGATRVALAVSTMRWIGPGFQGRSRELYGYFLNPYNFARTFVLMTWEAGRELVVATVLRLRGRLDCAKRSGSYPLTRAIATVLLRDIAVQLLLEDIEAGVPVSYATFAGYDAVAHCTGVESADARRVLRDLDRRLARLARRASRSPGCRLVVLSDHGQSPGASFSARYGMTLEEVIRGAAGRPASGDGPRRPDGATVRASVGSDDVAGHMDALVDELDPRHTAAARRILARRLDADLAPGADRAQGGGVAAPASRGVAEPQVAAEADVVVCASGNLALVYFPAVPGRATREAIEARHPGLLDTLVRHPGIGFVAVRVAAGGVVAFGAAGARHLATGRVVGVDPLAPFGDRAGDHLRRLADFTNAGDLIVNSAVWPDGSVAPFEEHIGSHGGVGGEQTDAFLLAPTDLPAADGALVGSAAMNRTMLAWLSAPLDGGVGSGAGASTGSA